MAPYARDFSLSMPVKLTSLAYPFVDVLLLAVVVRLTVGAGRREPAFYLLVAGAVALLATDAAYGMVQLSGVIYQNGGPLEAGWLSFYLLWGAAALHPSMRTLADRAGSGRLRFTRTRLVLLALATLMAPAVQAIQAVRHEHIDMPAAIGGSVTLFLLAMARMNGLVHKHEQAEGRERALREAGASFVSATGREGLYRAAIEATQSLTGSDAEISLALSEGSDGPLVVVASSAERAEPDRLEFVDPARLPEEISRTLEQHRAAPVHVVDDETRAVLGLSPDATTALVAPIYIRGQLRGELVVGAPRELPYQVSDGVEALASQTALALESAILTEDLHRRKSEARFASLVQNSSDVMTIIDADSTIRYQSPSILRVMGYEPEDLVGMKLLDFVHPDDVPTMTSLLADLASRPDGHPELVEFRWRHRDGTWLHVESLCSDLSLDPEVEGVVLNTRDVGERKAFEEQLSHQAFHDSITGLANRALFQNRVEHALERQRRDDRPIAVLFIDVDDFKTINDSLGHVAGDQVLTDVGERVAKCLRAADTAARLGGDEFAVLLEDAGYARAAEVAERLMAVLETPLQLEGKEVFVRASIGIAIGDEDRKGMRGAEELLRNADVAMYTAKSQGKARYQMFEPQMHTEVLRRLELKAELQRAVANDEFELRFQPVVELKTGRIAGMEALLRWRHPQRGIVAPMEFIPMAEETGLIVRIGTWVIQEACRHGVAIQARFPQEPPLSMSVNLSPRQLQQSELVDVVRDALQVSGLRPETLILEITETAMMQDTEMAILRLEQLKELGVKLAVDDFGTGYSSLNYLRRFPVDVLKVDKSFIDEVNDGGEQSALTAAIIELAATLQLRPVAEGIERQDQLDRLLELQCAWGQGFLFFEPLTRQQLEGVLRETTGSRTTRSA